jgi:glycosyltransferase involved in cell wall biosynthesis
MKITVATPRFAIAGVPLAQIRFAKSLASRGHEVTVLVGYVDPDFICPELSYLSVRVLNTPKVRNMLLPLLSYLRSEKPDVIFSAEDHLNTLFLIAAFLVKSKSKISGSSRVTPFDTYSNTPFSKGWILKQCARLMMPRADVLTCVSKDMVAQYQQVFDQPPHVCVYNIVADSRSQERMLAPLDHPWLTEKVVPTLIAAGRLAPWKGFGDLIEAISIVNAKCQIRLLILGDGPLRGELQALIDARGLNDSVQLVGYVENPLKYFSRADIFVLSSYVEGLPNVLVEAMMCGCTPVATDCPTGPREVLNDGKYGYLVKPRDPNSIANGILKAIENPITFDLLSQAVIPFKEEEVISRHFELLGLSERA